MLFKFRIMENVKMLDSADLYKFITEFNTFNEREFNFKDVNEFIRCKGRTETKSLADSLLKIETQVE